MSHEAASLLPLTIVVISGTNAFNFFNGSALMSLTTIFAGNLLHRLRPPSKIRAIRPPPIKPTLFPIFHHHLKALGKCKQANSKSQRR